MLIIDQSNVWYYRIPENRRYFRGEVISDKGRVFVVEDVVDEFGDSRMEDDEVTVDPNHKNPYYRLFLSEIIPTRQVIINSDEASPNTTNVNKFVDLRENDNILNMSTASVERAGKQFKIIGQVSQSQDLPYYIEKEDWMNAYICILNTKI